MTNCHNPSLGLMIKARVYKGVGQEGSSGVTSDTPGSVEFTLWELKFQWTSKYSDSNCRGGNLLD